MLGRVQLHLFEEVAETLRGTVPVDLGEPRFRSHRDGLKVWFGPDKPEREHYEAQLIKAAYVDGAGSVGLEVGFHAEYPDVADNDKVIDHLLRHEERWRKRLGDDAVVGPFLGRADVWRRVSEAWPDPDLGDGDLAIEIALRLADYVTALEPIRRSR
jgi:hypothetical protein